MKQVFLSYNRDYDSFFADRLKRYLEESSRFQVVDSYKAGFETELASQIRSQIQRASMVIALFHSTNKNVFLETGIALGAGKPILIVGSEPESLPVGLRSLPYIPISGDIETDSATIMRRLDSLNIEEEHPRTVQYRLGDKLRTYTDDPEYFESIAPAEFEELLVERFEANGFKINREVKSHDFGIDLVARSPIDQSTIVMEAKKFNRQSRVSLRDVMALLGAAAFFKASTAVLITSSSFTRAALEMAAESKNPKLRLLTMDEILQSQDFSQLLQ
jgi:Restriction endonuclease